jgi:chaperonin GroES
MKLVPMFDRVIIQASAKKVSTPGGIVIPDSVTKEKEILGTVVAVANSPTGAQPDGGKRLILLPDGTLSESFLKVGTKVLFNVYSATKVKSDDQEYFIIRDSDVLCMVVDDE